MSNPFEYVNAINYTKENIMVDEHSEKNYNPFITNRSLSYFPDTILMANEMNKYHQIDKKLQFDCLINSIRKRKRFSKWNKQKTIDDLEVVKEYYCYSNEKAHQVLMLLNETQINELKKKVNKGGKQ